MSLPPEHAIKSLDDAIATGSLQLARSALADHDTLQPQQAAYYLNTLLLQNQFSYQSRAIRGDTPRLAGLMAPTEATYEQSLASMAEQIARRADMRGTHMEPVKMIALAAGGYEFRRPAALAVLKEALKQEPNWRPDVPGHFACIGQEDDYTPEETHQFRVEVAAQIRHMGQNIRSWLQETPGVANRMHPFTKQWWLDEHWDVNPYQMPWANSDRIRQENQRARLARDAAAPDEEPRTTPGAVRTADDLIKKAMRSSKTGRKPPRLS